jgi:hypothetical protein
MIFFSDASLRVCFPSLYIAVLCANKRMCLTSGSIILGVYRWLEKQRKAYGSRFD